MIHALSNNLQWADEEIHFEYDPASLSVIITQVNRPEGEKPTFDIVIIRNPVHRQRLIELLTEYSIPAPTDTTALSPESNQ